MSQAQQGLLSPLIPPSPFPWLWFRWIVGRDSGNLVHPFMRPLSSSGKPNGQWMWVGKRDSPRPGTYSLTHKGPPRPDWCLLSIPLRVGLPATTTFYALSHFRASQPPPYPPVGISFIHSFPWLWFRWIVGRDSGNLVHPFVPLAVVSLDSR